MRNHVSETLILFHPTHLAARQRLEGAPQLLVLDAGGLRDLRKTERVHVVEQHQHHRLREAHRSVQKAIIGLHTRGGTQALKSPCLNSIRTAVSARRIVGCNIPRFAFRVFEGKGADQCAEVLS